MLYKKISIQSVLTRNNSIPTSDMGLPMDILHSLANQFIDAQDMIEVKWFLGNRRKRVLEISKKYEHAKGTHNYSSYQVIWDRMI